MEKATTRISPDVPQDIRRTQAVGCPKSASIFGRTQRPFATTTEAAPRNWAKLELGPSPSPLPPPTKDSSNKLKDTPVERSAAARYPVLKLKKVKPVSLHMCMIPIVIHPGSTSGKNPGQDASQGAFPRQNVPAAQARPNAKGNGERPTQHSPFIQHTAAPSTVRAASRTRQPAPSHDAQGSVCHPIVARNDHLWPVSPPETERKAPPGMVNLGNSCYQNSVIQMLMSSNQFLSLLEQYSCRGPLSTQLYQVTSQLQRIGVTPAVNAQALKNAMDRKTHHFRGTHQQDAHEFVVKMLELLEEEFKEEPPPQVTRNQRYPTDCFRMTVQVEKQCNSCRSKSTPQIETYNHISVKLPISHDDGGVASGATVQNCFQNDFFRPDLRDVRCEKCSKETQCTYTNTKIISRPRLLLIHLKRYLRVQDGERCYFKKIKGAVEISGRLLLSDNVATSDQQKSNLIFGSNYSLRSIVHHDGESPHSGHYTADAVRLVEPEKEQWFTLNDGMSVPCNVDDITGDDRKKRTAYLLLYDCGKDPPMDGCTTGSSSDSEEVQRFRV